MCISVRERYIVLIKTLGVKITRHYLTSPFGVVVRRQS